ncbi:unnamed protein product [Brachionus calyciflorus]|uniref:Peptidase S1 domain-containing protein n=1 Tax=Brachionus calyciflorus TaxID=104777 RepID=A0A813VFM8_9BILA|nr:unnamed protein product [Brachionus calyciflorus]
MFLLILLFPYGLAVDLSDISLNSQAIKFPYVVSLGFMGQNTYIHRCSATILTNQHVLTSTQCVKDIHMDYDAETFNKKHGRVLVVVAGTGKIELPKMNNFTKIYLVKKISVKMVDEKNHTDHLNIAVLKLEKKIEFNSRIRPIRLPVYRPPQSIFGKIVITVDWNSNESDKKTRQLEMTEMKVLNNMNEKNECQGVKDRNHYCVKSIRSKSIKNCSRDLGGPMVYRDRNQWLLYGIKTSENNIKCESTSIYTMLPISLRWIFEQFKKL